MHIDLDQATRAAVSRLRRLPEELPPPWSWPEFRRRSPRPGSTSPPMPNWRQAAIAAVLVLVVCGIAVWSRSDHRAAQVAAEVSSGRTADDAGRGAGHAPLPAPVNARTATGANTLAMLSAEDGAERSRAIEGWLATLPREPIVIRVGTRAAVAGLEDRIAQVDDLLTAVQFDGSDRERLAALQQERVRLVGSLAQVRYAEVVAAESP